MLYIGSDVHLTPEGKRWHLEGFLEEAMSPASEGLVVVGDLYDLARYSWKDIVDGPDGGRYHRLLCQASMKVPFHYILGNHDYNLMAYRNLLPSTFRIHPRSYALGKVLFVHGWLEYDISLAWLAPFYSWLFPHFPRFAFLYDRLFPTPSVVKKQSLPQFYREVLRMHFRAMADSMRRDRTIIFGHTHWQQVAPIYVSPNQIWLMGNAGDFIDGPGGLLLNTKTGFLHVWRP